MPVWQRCGNNRTGTEPNRTVSRSTADWNFEIDVNNESNVIKQKQNKHEEQDQETQAEENQEEKIQTKKSQEENNLEESEEKIEDSTKLKILNKIVKCYVLKTEKEIAIRHLMNDDEMIL